MATLKLNARRPSHAIGDNPDPTPPKAKALSVDIAPSPDAGEAITLRQQAAMIVIDDRASHTQALEFVRGAKQLKRKIEDHWVRITRNVDDLKRNLLDLKRADLEPVEMALTQIDGRIVDYVNAEQRRQREEEDRQRKANEAQARLDRERELARQEQEAADLEAQSPTLSAREAEYCRVVMAGGAPWLLYRTGELAMYDPKSLNYVAGTSSTAFLWSLAANSQAVYVGGKTARPVGTSLVSRHPVNDPNAKIEQQLGGDELILTMAATDSRVAALGENGGVWILDAADLTPLKHFNIGSRPRSAIFADGLLYIVTMREGEDNGLLLVYEGLEE